MNIHRVLVADDGYAQGRAIKHEGIPGNMFQACLGKERSPRAAGFRLGHPDTGQAGFDHGGLGGAGARHVDFKRQGQAFGGWGNAAPYVAQACFTLGKGACGEGSGNAGVAFG